MTLKKKYEYQLPNYKDTVAIAKEIDSSNNRVKVDILLDVVISYDEEGEVRSGDQVTVYISMDEFDMLFEPLNSK